MSSAVEVEYVDCPVCGATEQTIIRNKDGWNITQCPSCTLAMVNPRRKNSTEIYKDDAYFQDADYYYDYVGNKAAYQKGFRSKLKLINEHCSRKGNLLDVGAAYGFFMEEASKFGFRAYGVELSRGAAEHAAKYGTVFHATLSDAPIRDRFSVVTFIDSLEHFEKPLEGLEKAWHLLEENGLVAVMVPNIDSRVARIAGNRWHLLLPEEHLYYFTRQSIKAMLEKANFDVLCLGSGGYGRSLSEIIHVILRGHNFTLKYIEKLLRHITFEVNLGDIFAIARKTG